MTTPRGKGKPRGRKGGRKPFPVPLIRITVHIPADLRDWLKDRGDISGQVRAALEAYRESEAE